MPNDDDEGYANEKLVPEWRLRADDQILLIGLLVVLALFMGIGWNLIWGGDDETVIASVTTVDGSSTTLDGANGSAAGTAGAVGVTTTSASAQATTATEAQTSTSRDDASTGDASTTSTETDTTDSVGDVGDVQAAVDPLPGDITASANGTTAVLTGYVANQSESDEAEDAAAAVPGVTAVDNQLKLLEPDVQKALTEAGVVGPQVTGTGTEMVVAGTIASEEDRQPTLDAAAAVPGVTSVVDDKLQVSVTDQLNALPQVQFATGSAVILESSYGDLDKAAELLKAAGDGIAVEVQGYTDVRGSEESNLALSQQRTESVVTYLVNAGVNPQVLTAKGYGETEQFGAGESDEALAANRVVRFEQTK